MRRVARDGLKTDRTDKTERSEGLAEREGFEPPCPLRDKTLSRRPRYDHFGTSPQRLRAWRNLISITGRAYGSSSTGTVMVFSR